eukprot:gb/GFBE01074609.1/.p1 GENE.gb/GFBE01074609.1/~~gb/GFBE01074609.1/.p1  ORF type:complete len:222 (+),score=70.03 gb/GFBE01074609.1/:1-666(+)
MAGSTETEEPPTPPMPQFSISQLVPLGVSMLASKVDFEKEGLVHHVEIAYVVAQLLCIAGLGHLYTKIQALPEGGTKIKVPEVKQMGQVVSPAVEQTVKEYDMTKLEAQAKQVVIGCVILAGIYFTWGYVFPLVLQIVMTPMQLVESPLFKIYVFGSDVKRPFPEPNPFGLPQAPEPAAPEAATEAVKDGAGKDQGKEDKPDEKEKDEPTEKKEDAEKKDD